MPWPTWKSGDPVYISKTSAAVHPLMRGREATVEHVASDGAVRVRLLERMDHWVVDVGHRDLSQREADAPPEPSELELVVAWFREKSEAHPGMRWLLGNVAQAIEDGLWRPKPKTPEDNFRAVIQGRIRDLERSMKDSNRAALSERIAELQSLEIQILERREDSIPW